MENPELNRLQVVVFDVPYPPDYGGAMDVYYRLKALRDAGIQLDIHVFEYGRGTPEKLNELGAVSYYPRQKSVRALFSRRPFIVATRINQKLLHRLKQENAPILFEGIHTTWYLEDLDIQKRCTLVRMHNIEHEYYLGLIKHAGIFKRLFFWLESIKLRKYESIIGKAACVLAIKPSDATHFERHNKSTVVLPASLSEDILKIPIKKTAPFALFHGNLSVSENDMGARWVMQALNDHLSEQFPLVLAGKNPSKNLGKLVDGKRIKLISNPSESEMNRLIADAHIHVMYSEVNSGTKLKFLSSLAANGHVLVNKNISGDIIKNEHFHVANDSPTFASMFHQLVERQVGFSEIEARKRWVHASFGNQLAVKKISAILSAYQDTRMH